MNKNDSRKGKAIMKKEMTKSEWEKVYGMKWGTTTKSPRQEKMEKTITTQAAEIKRLRELLESLNAIIKEEMGEWYAVEYGYVPIRLSNVAHMRDAITELTSAAIPD